ncbi:Rha family transcriptional regulator [Pseudomonas kairouanensis]|nr:Rha family transcriptional regulator [Pseudomonas kairouanensis]
MLTQIGSELRVDSRQLVNLLGNQHKSSLTLIERHSEKFKEFGLLAFETEARPAGRYERGSVRFALLNEDQAFFLLALFRNTDRVVELKYDLIMAFRKARYDHTCQSLEARKREASNSGRRLAHWRYDKPGMHQQVIHLREQLKLPLGL